MHNFQWKSLNAIKAKFSCQPFKNLPQNFPSYFVDFQKSSNFSLTTIHNWLCSKRWPYQAPQGIVSNTFPQEFIILKNLGNVECGKKENNWTQHHVRELKMWKNKRSTCVFAGVMYSIEAANWSFHTQKNSISRLSLLLHQLQLIQVFFCQQRKNLWKSLSSGSTYTLRIDESLVYLQSTSACFYKYISNMLNHESLKWSKKLFGLLERPCRKENQTFNYFQNNFLMNFSPNNKKQIHANLFCWFFIIFPFLSQHGNILFLLISVSSRWSSLISKLYCCKLRGKISCCKYWSILFNPRAFSWFSSLEPEGVSFFPHSPWNSDAVPVLR